MIIVFLLIGFVLLIKGADFFVDGASGLARKYKLSEMFIGLTIVAFGTSAPELFVNIQSALHGYTELALGNIIGSNIANIALILGIGILLGKLILGKDIQKNLLISLFFGVLLLVVLGIGDLANGSQLPLWIGLVLLLAFVGYFWYAYRNSSLPIEHEEPIIESKNIRILILMIVGGLLAITFGGELVIKNAINIAEYFDISGRIIGLTIVAIGTSLPELITTIVSVKKGHHAIGVGNIIGSNIFNIGLIGGLTAVVHPISFEKGVYYDLAVLLLITLLFRFVVKHNKEYVKKWQGIGLLVIYVLYILSLLLVI